MQPAITPNILDIKPFQLENEADFHDGFFFRFCHVFPLIRKIKEWLYKYSYKKKFKKKYLPTINFQHICWQKGLQKSHLLSETERGHKDFTMGLCLVVVETLCPVN